MNSPLPPQKRDLEILSTWHRLFVKEGDAPAINEITTLMNLRLPDVLKSLARLHKHGLVGEGWARAGSEVDGYPMLSITAAGYEAMGLVDEKPVALVPAECHEVVYVGGSRDIRTEASFRATLSGYPDDTVIEVGGEKYCVGNNGKCRRWVHPSGGEVAVSALWKIYSQSGGFLPVTRGITAARVLHEESVDEPAAADEDSVYEQREAVSPPVVPMLTEVYFAEEPVPPVTNHAPKDSILVADIISHIEQTLLRYEYVIKTMHLFDTVDDGADRFKEISFQIFMEGDRLHRQLWGALELLRSLGVETPYGELAEWESAGYAIWKDGPEIENEFVVRARESGLQEPA